MLLRFSTKRDRNGNRYFLGIDTEKKTFATTSAHWYTRDDLTAEITRKNLRNLREEAEKAGYKEQYSI